MNAVLQSLTLLLSLSNASEGHDLPVPVTARTATVYWSMGVSPKPAAAPVQAPLWVRRLAATVLRSPKLPGPLPRPLRGSRTRPVLELAGGGVCLGLTTATQRAAWRLELVAGTRAAALNFRF